MEARQSDFFRKSTRTHRFQKIGCATTCQAFPVFVSPGKYASTHHVDVPARLPTVTREAHLGECTQCTHVHARARLRAARIAARRLRAYLITRNGSAHPNALALPGRSFCPNHDPASCHFVGFVAFRCT